MDYQLTIPAMVRRAEQLHRNKSIASRGPDKRVHHNTYGESIARARRLAGALRALGVRDDDRVATLCWNHRQHFEAYLGVPSMGAILHTLNVRLRPDELGYIANHAGDKAIIVDRSLLSVFERFREQTQIEHVIVVDGDGDIPAGAHDYETLIAGSRELSFNDDLDERQAAALCYTSGTTGRPKGVLYSHRSTVLHSLACGYWDLEFVREREVIMPIVPMFHANAWGLPYSCLVFGADLVLPGPFLDAASVLELLASERVTVSAGVPTIWLAVLQALDAAPEKYDLSALRMVTAGGASVPEVLIRAFQERYGLRIMQGWGMTETSPVGTLATLGSAFDDADADTQYGLRATAGLPLPLVETRVRTDDGIVPWGSDAMGELEVRGPWVAAAYYGSPESADRFTDDGWFKTGDIVTIDAQGYVTIRDRAKDVIKSGGEWISSVTLENALMKHPAVAEAAVVGLRHPKWDERPLALVVVRAGSKCVEQELIDHLAGDFPKFWIPSAFEFVEAIPRTSVGKIHKLAIRDQYRDYFMPTIGLPESATKHAASLNS
jgi:fatty-acyl-CoA synthase